MSSTTEQNKEGEQPSFLQDLVRRILDRSKPEVAKSLEGKNLILSLIWMKQGDIITGVKVELIDAIHTDRPTAEYELMDPQSIELDNVGPIIYDIYVADEPNAYFYWGANRHGKQYRSYANLVVQDNGTWLVDSYLPLTPPEAVIDQH